MRITRQIIILSILLWTKSIFGQEADIIKNCKTEFDSIANRTIYTYVDEMPEFIGGYDSLKKFILTNLILPPDDGSTYEGTVFISAIVEIDGSLTNKKIIRGIYKPADDAALDLIDKMPKWKNGKCKGIAVPVRYYIPVNFTFY